MIAVGSSAPATAEKEVAMSPVSIVTDSTGYVPRSTLESLGVQVVSLRYTFGDGVWLGEYETEDWGPFYERLQGAGVLATTSPPTEDDFVETYGPLLARGGSVLSIHISSGLSETCAVARRAAQRLELEGRGGERVMVLDSAAAAGQLGLLGIVAARAAAKTRDIQLVADRVRQARIEARNWDLLDTLEFLKRGGRIGTATAWIGSTLNIKPIITLESEIRAVERVRSREKGVARLVEFARQHHANGADAWVVQHSAAHDDAKRLVESLTEVFRRAPEFVSEFGAVLGAHTGPGVIAFCALPSRFLE